MNWESFKASFRIMGGFKGLDGGGFDLRRLVESLGLIGVVKIRIKGGS